MKKQFATDYVLQQTLADLNLEDEIKEVIDSLADLQSVGTLETLSITALEIDQKILPENCLLKKCHTKQRIDLLQIHQYFTRGNR